MPAYSVIVSNIGIVADNINNFIAALNEYGECVRASKEEHGRMSGESVTLMCDNEPFKAYEPVTYYIEVTDSFAGEANYSWVKRFSVTFDSKLSKLARMRLFKETIGWTGHRCDSEDYGDSLRINPRGVCQVAFVTYRDE